MTPESIYEYVCRCYWKQDMTPMRIAATFEDLKIKSYTHFAGNHRFLTYTNPMSIVKMIIDTEKKSHDMAKEFRLREYL